MGSDMTPETRFVKGNAISLMLHCASEENIRIFFDKLSKGGTIKHTTWKYILGALFGDLTDKFGNNWVLNFDKKN